MTKRKTTAEFKQQAIDIYGDKYDFSEVDYKNTKIKVKITCKEHDIVFYQLPSTLLNNHIGCSICAQEKKIQTNINKFGVEHAAQSPEIKEKAKQTCLAKFKYESPSQSPEIKEKIRLSCLKNNGVGYPLQSPEIYGKMVQTNLERYDVKNTFQFPKFKEKSRQTNLERLGVEYAGQSSEVQEKMRQTNLERLGVEYAGQSSEVQEKMRQTNLERHDVEYFSQKYVPAKSLKLLNNREWLIHQHYIEKLPLYKIGINLHINESTVGRYFKKHNIEVIYFPYSQGEKDVNSFINSLDFKTTTNIRTILPKNREIDIYVPSLNKAIEYNGLYWHKNKGINYHRNKTLNCAKQNIQLMHIWEDQWLNNQEKSKEMIIKFLNDQPQQELLETITIDLATDNPQIYLDLGYEIVSQLLPELYSEGVWDCGKMILHKK